MLPLSYVIQLLRPRTLLLGVAVMLPGNATAWHDGHFDGVLFVLMLMTGLSLQALSNIANDYGDGKRGTDEHRIGPTRMVASGALSLRTVQILMWGCSILTLVLGGFLLFVAFDHWCDIIDFAVMGIIAILAAVGYTVGRHAYGYYGLGEAAVFVFFGLMVVMGGYYLQTHNLNHSLWVVACGCGLFSTAVLMVNNLRDLDSDHAAGKHTIAVRLGRRRAHILYGLTLCLGLLCYLLYGLLTAQWTVFLCLFIIPLLINHVRRLFQANSAQQCGAELPVIVQINVVVNVLFCIGILL